MKTMLYSQSPANIGYLKTEFFISTNTGLQREYTNE